MCKILFSVLVCLLCFAGARAGSHTVAARGQAAAYVIIYPADATAAERYAAEELRDFLQRVTGVALPMMSARPNLPARAIVVGGNWSRPDLSEDGFHLHTTGTTLYIQGGRTRGVLYGVYEFLEKFAGCRWYTSWYPVIPHRACVTVPDNLDVAQRPAFDMRTPFWYDVIKHPAFAARLRVNSLGWALFEPKYGGNPFRFGGGLVSCHTFNTLVPPDEFFGKHPEYFSYENGKRVKHPSQLCLTNPDVLRLVIARVLARIRQDPGAKFYGVSQNDWHHYCQCPQCAAVDAEEESHAGTMVRFVNAVAEAVEREFPDVIIETLAYLYTRKPPKITKLRHNVVPCLCTIECDFARPLDKSAAPQNIQFCRDIAGWREQTDQLYLWDYTTNFRSYTQPFANVLTLQCNLQFFRRNKVHEMFEQGAFQGRHADFAELKAWLLAKWMWNPDLPQEDLLREFFAAYYGKGAPYVRAYFDEVHALQQAYSRPADRPLTLYIDDTNPALSDVFLEKAATLWQRAADAVQDDPAISYNVRMGAFSVDTIRLERLRRKTEKLAYFIVDPKERAEKVLRRQLAQKQVACLNEAGDIRLSEIPEVNTEQLQAWYALATNGVSDTALFSVVKTNAVIEDAAINCSKMGTWGARVDDPQAEDGRALKLFNTHYEWCANFHLSRIAFKPGVKYTVRARIRCEKASEGEAFWAGVYDPVAKCSRGSIARTTRQVGDGYAWYDICTLVPNDQAYFWIGPGRFAKGSSSAIRGVLVDKIAFVEVPEKSKN